MNKNNYEMSLFDEIKEEVHKLLEFYPYEKVVDSTLYIVDEELIKKLDTFNKDLNIKYGDDITAKKYSLANIVKIINPLEPCNWYNTYKGVSWKQVNDTEKVLLRLDSEFAKYKNKIRKFTKKQIKEKNIPEDKELLIMDNIEDEIIQAEKELVYIKENFDELDVRISTYFERIDSAFLSYVINKKRKSNQNLRKTVVNVLWFKELSQNDKTRTDNELQKYFKFATRAFGDIFYTKKSEYERPLKDSNK